MIRMDLSAQVCFVSGARGYLGSRVTAALEERDWQVIELSRAPNPGRRAISFQLGTEISSSTLGGGRSLVHCAYDFRPLKWRDIHRINVIGTEKLFRAARESGVINLIYISSISAFEGCRSLYGAAKLEAEAVAKSLGAIIIRPGLIWGDSPGAMFGKLVKQVEQARVLPLFGDGAQIQYLVHDQDLVGFILDCASGKIPPQVGPITIAHEEPWQLRHILEEIATAKRKRVSFIPVPWRLAWAFLKFAESAGIRLKFRSDSLVSLMHQNPSPSFAAQQSLKVNCRHFQLAAAKASV